MSVEKALNFANKLMLDSSGKHLDKAQSLVLRELWQDDKKTYKKIAHKHDYTESYLKEVGAGLWNLLSNLLEKKVTKGTFKAAVEQYWQQQDFVGESVQKIGINSNFIGRDRQIAELNNLIEQGAKVIVIQGKGGVGKTTLARNYFKNQGFYFLQLRMGKEIQNISSVESVVEEWLQREFNEEPALDFSINLERLRRKLQDQTRKVGVLINSLETALDGSGKLIESRRAYIQLLEVLADPDVHSITLITSREPLYESSVEVARYRLQGLDEDAWGQFFASRDINSNSSAIGEMSRAYGGNAKAMQILSGVILTDFHGDIDAYWHGTKQAGDLLIERELKDLVTSQFNRLQENNLSAYKLLCRLGCYYYQEIPSLPIEALLCLLWDVPEIQQKRVIRDLQDLSLIEFDKGQYWLHSVIMTEAKHRLKLTEDWKIANRQAAQFWTQSVDVIQDTKDALMALEAFYHYVAIADYEQASDVILKGRGKHSDTGLSLGCSLYHFGLPQKNISVIPRVVDNIKDVNIQISLYNLLGYTYRIIGSLVVAIECFDKSMKILENSQIEQENTKVSIWFNTAICKVELWEIKEAQYLFNKICQIGKQSGKYNNYIAYSQCCLAFLDSYSSLREETFIMAENAKDMLSSCPTVTPWGMAHNLVNLAASYKNLGHLEKSREICERAILNSEENKFMQIKARAISCLAEINREQQKFDQAISQHLKAIEMLYIIGAKGDLAEAYYQLAVTYQKLGEVKNSQENFDNAIRLFQEMQAPKQVEKIQQARKELGGRS